MSDPSIESMVAEAVDSLRGVEGVTTWPGATAEAISAAESELGVRFPADYRALLCQTNGLELCYGLRRVLGVGSTAPVDVAWFNRPEGWRRVYPDRVDLDAFVHIIVQDTPETIAYHKPSLAGELDAPELWYVQPEMPDSGSEMRSLLWYLTDGWQKMARAPFADPVTAQYVRKFGPIAMRECVLPGPAEFWPPFDYTQGADRAQLVGLEEAFIMYADLDRHAEEIRASIPEGRDVRLLGVNIVTKDPRGFPRTEWRYEIV